MYTPILNLAQMRIRNLQDSGAPRLERRCKQLNALKSENQERTRRLIELRHSAPGEREVRDLNLFVNRLTAYEDCCFAAQKIIRLTFRQAGGFYDSRSVGIEHAVIGE